MKKTIFRTIQNFNALLTLFVLMASFYFQYIVGLVPCPLCIMQRICVFLLLIIMGISFSTIRKAHIMCLLQTIVACAGLFFSVRQLWLQSLPPENAPACMPGLDVLIQYFPWQTVAKTLLWGSGDCSEVSWYMLGVSMPGWCALYFSLMVLSGGYLYWNTRLKTLYE